MKGIISLFILSLSFGLAFGQEIKQLTLKQAQDYAIENSYAAKNADLDLLQAKSQVKLTKSDGLPQINGSVQFQNFFDIPTQGFFVTGPNGEQVLQTFQFGSDYTTTAGITANQLIFDGSFFVALKAAKSYVELSEGMVDKSDIDIKDMVTRSYIGALVAEENKALLQQNVKTVEKNLNDVSAMYENGFLEEQDVDQARLLLSNLRNSVERADQGVTNSYNLLKFQLGLPLKDQIELTETLETLITQVDGPSLLEKKFDFTSHIDYQLAVTNNRLMELNLKNKRATYYPKLSAFATRSENTFYNSFGDLGDAPWFPATFWGVTLDVPILSGGRRSAIYQQTKFDLERSEIALAQAEEAITLEAANAKTNYAFALKQYNIEKENLALAERIRNKTSIKYKEGISSSMDLTQAENQYLSTQGQYINSIFELMNAKSDIDKALSNY